MATVQTSTSSHIQIIVQGYMSQKVWWCRVHERVEKCPSCRLPCAGGGSGHGVYATGHEHQASGSDSLEAQMYKLCKGFLDQGQCGCQISLAAEGRSPNSQVTDPSCSSYSYSAALPGNPRCMAQHILPVVGVAVRASVVVMFEGPC